MEPDRNFPRLTPDNHRTTSPSTRDYNCIAWAVHDVERWWQPGDFWPIVANREDCGIDALERAFLSLGFEPCDDEDVEPGFEKVALYGNNLLYTHAARQLADGKWTSKLGKSEDIEHETPDVVAGGIYGEVVEVMKRPIEPA